MSFFSTRGGACVTASQAVLYGLAKDGGLYVPAIFQPLTTERLASLCQMSYQERAARVLRNFLEDYAISEIEASVNAAYASPAFDEGAVAPVKALDGNTYILELFHGPTLAFKDMALKLLPHLITLAAQKNGETREISILVATSGDTGKAALEGFQDVKGTSCTVFYPKDGVSAVQEKQMVTTGGKNTHVIGVHGNFDDTQTGVKKLFSSEDFHEKMNRLNKLPSSANSINFGRLAPQVVYYFSAYCDLVKTGAVRMGQEIDFVVPTGNFGDILAGYYAKRMGLPIRTLLCASNRNNVLTDFFTDGIYYTHRAFFQTLSPSMDILISSNLERLLYEIADRDPELVSTWMELLKTCGSYSIGDTRLRALRQTFYAGCADDNMTMDEIARVYERNHYVLDPHTAVASHVLRQYREKSPDRTPAVIISTASPYKFASDVYAAIAGRDKAEGLNAFQSAAKLEKLTGLQMPKQVRALETAPVRHHALCEVGGMEKAVLDALKG